MNISGLNLPTQGVYIVWKWEWEDDCDDDNEYISWSSSNDHNNPDIQSYSESDSEENDSTMSHTVTFKCIGTTHDVHAQEILKKASKLLESGDVPVAVVAEPDNQYDSQAIAFKAKVDGQWHRIGYIVREALSYVHTALKDDLIISVKFSWIKYLVVWPHSGPGYYAGINITIKGKWPTPVCKCGSK